MDGEHRWRAARELSGATYSQIADTLGWASSLSAHEAVMSALARDNERVGSIRDEYRMLHLPAGTSAPQRVGDRRHLSR